MSFGANLTALGDTMPWVTENLKKISGGSINLKVFEPGKLVPALGIFDAVSTGKVEAGYSFMGDELGKVPVSAIFGAMPFGMETPQFVAWMYFGGGDALLKEAYKPHNVHPILCGSISPEAAGWFLILIAVMLQTSFLTPPVGFSLFYLKGVVPKGVTIQDIYIGDIPFVLLQLLMVILCLVFPQIVLWLPQQMYGGT